MKPEQHQVQWIAVRCCCTPTKVLGFLSLDAETIARRQFRSPHIDGTVEIREIMDSTASPGGVEIRRELAIYSEDRPIEAWRAMPGFVEAVASLPRPVRRFDFWPLPQDHD